MCRPRIIHTGGVFTNCAVGIWMATQFSAVDPESVKDIECNICLEPWDDPVELEPCRHIYCRRCTESLRTCPDCRATISNRTQPNRILINQANAAVVRCEACRWQGTREASRSHRNCLPVPTAATSASPSAPPVRRPAAANQQQPGGDNALPANPWAAAHTPASERNPFAGAATPQGNPRGPPAASQFNPFGGAATPQGNPRGPPAASQSSPFAGAATPQGNLLAQPPASQSNPFGGAATPQGNPRGPPAASQRNPFGGPWTSLQGPSENVSTNSLPRLTEAQRRQIAEDEALARALAMDDFGRDDERW
jgi:hypothetical protein